MPYNQVRPPLMRSLLDQVSETRETQVCSSIQPYSAGPAEQSVPEPAEDVSVILMVKSCSKYVTACCAHPLLNNSHAHHIVLYSLCTWHIVQLCKSTLYGP